MLDESKHNGDTRLKWVTECCKRRKAKPPIDSADWEKHKDLIVFLYKDRNQTREEVIQALNVKGLDPS